MVSDFLSRVNLKKDSIKIMDISLFLSPASISKQLQADVSLIANIADLESAKNCPASISDKFELRELENSRFVIDI